MDSRNYIENNKIHSDVVYPQWSDTSKFLILGQLDKDYVRYELLITLSCDKIANKYAIHMNNGLLWYQHDDMTFILQKL